MIQVLGVIALIVGITICMAGVFALAIRLGHAADDRWGEECHERSAQYGTRKSHAWDDAWGDVTCIVCGKTAYIEYGR